MKIDPQLPPLPQPAGAQQPAAGQSFQSFQEMLGGESGPETPQRAMAFVELGMFGRGGVEVPGANAVTPESQLAAAAAETGDGIALPVDPAVSRDAQLALEAPHLSIEADLPKEVMPAAQQAQVGLPAQHQASSAGAPADARPRTTARITSVLRTPHMSAPAAFAPAKSGPEGAEAAEAPEAAAPDAPGRHEEPSETPVRLAFNERDGSASIVAAAGNLTPEQRASLRRRTAELLLEHGILLSKFTLNGTALGGLTHYRNGDTHGPRTN